MNNTELLELELVNLRELYRLNDLNKDLLDANRNLLTRLCQIYKRHNIPIQGIEIDQLLGRIREILDEKQTPKLNTKKNDDENPDYLPEVQC
jgi:hypothetical protein